MDFINQLSEAVNPGGNPVIFYLIAGIGLIVFIMMLRSILHIVVLLLVLGVIGMGVAYYNGYDFSGLQAPDLSSVGTTTSDSTEGGASTSSIEDTINNTVGDTIKQSLPDFGDLFDNSVGDIKNIINEAVRNISK